MIAYILIIISTFKYINSTISKNTKLLNPHLMIYPNNFHLI